MNDPDADRTEEQIDEEASLPAAVWVSALVAIVVVVVVFLLRNY